MDKEEFIISTPDNRQFRVSKLGKEILQQLDGRKNLDEVVEEIKKHHVDISANDLDELLKNQYAPLGIVEMPGAPDRVEVGRASLDRAAVSFLLCWKLIPEKYVRLISRRLEFFYSRGAVAVGIPFIIVTHYLVYTQQPGSAPVSGPGSLFVLALCLLSALWHEFGHATALSKFGGSPGTIGFGLYVLLPSFFADVSEAWRFRRKQRIVVDLGGIYFQELFFGVSALLAIYTSNYEFYAICNFIDLIVIINLNPIFQFDGYWFLVDCLALPNLYRRALSFIRQSLKRLVDRDCARATLPPMRRPVYVVFVVYAVVCNVFLLFLLWASFRYVSGLFTQMPRVFSDTWLSILTAISNHDISLFLSRSLTLLFALAFLGTALFGIYKYVVALSRFCLNKVKARRLSKMSPTLSP